jgi:hypothetical protein
MTLVFLGREAQDGQSPTVWADGSDYLIQGYTLDPQTQAQVGAIPDGEAVIRVPKTLMAHLAKDIDGKPCL